jgi:GT2 family glycosyltransferase
MKPVPLVSCIIVTYNSSEYITSCLESLCKNRYPTFEIIVVDNNSQDDTLLKIDTIAKKYPKQQLIVKATDQNLGYASGNNLGVSLAKGEYIFIVNPDTIVDSHFLQPLVDRLANDEQLAVVQPAVYLLQDPKTLNLTGKETHYLGMDWVKNYKSQELPPSGRLYSFSGSGFLIKKNIFDKLGGFDSQYFMYYEDTDLSWRIQLAGFKIFFENKSKLFHDYKYEPDESYQSLKQKLFYAERNRLVTFFKNYQLITLLLFFPVFILLELSLTVFAFMEGWGTQKISAYRELFTLSHHISNQRNYIKKIRKVTDKQILSHMVSTITFEKFQHPILTHLLNPIFQLYHRVVMFLL